MIDIQATDNRDWVEAAIDSSKTDCEIFTTTDTTDWGSDDEGNPAPPKDTIEKLCPNQCSGNGECIDGSCKCNNGWMGVSCNFNGKTPPFVTPTIIRCDYSKYDCSEVTIIGTFFETDELFCELTPVLSFSVRIFKYILNKLKRTGH